MDVAHLLGQADQLPIWGSVLALSQTSGRGQLGRTWASPAGNIYAALRLPLLHPFTSTAAAPAMGGLLASALQAMDFPVWMKWPNDMIQQTETSPQGWCKVGGILLEERPCLPGNSSTSSQSMLIAGVGLNLVSAPPEHLMRADRAMPAGRLISVKGEISVPLSPVLLWIELVSRIFFCYADEMQSEGEHAWRNVSERHLACRGQRVLLVDGSEDQDRHTGILEGLDDSGGLVLRGYNGSTQSFLSGSLR